MEKKAKWTTFHGQTKNDKTGHISRSEGVFYNNFNGIHVIISKTPLYV